MTAVMDTGLIQMDEHAMVFCSHLVVDAKIGSAHLYCSDINECMEEVDNCVQNCANIVGSFVCNCSSGFLLDDDGYSCNGDYNISDC